MNRSEFIKLPNFSYQELENHYKVKGYNSVDAEFEINKINSRVFTMLQQVRTQLNASIKLNCLTDGNHVAGSFHYQGKAVDFHCGDYNIHPNKIFQALLTAGFKGIGWYPGWNRPGFHCDIGDRDSVKVWQRVSGIYKPLIEMP